MPFDWILWDPEDDPRGNVRHCAEHGFTKEEVVDVLESPIEVEASRSSGRPLAFGFTRTGRYAVVIYERIDDQTIYPITAYEVENAGG